MDLKRLYSEYQKLNENRLFSTNCFFDRFPHSVKKLKLEIQGVVNESIALEDKELHSPKCTHAKR